MSYSKIKQIILECNTEHLNQMLFDLSCDRLSYSKSEQKTLFILNSNNCELKESLNQSFECIRAIHSWSTKKSHTNQLCQDFAKIKLAMSKNNIPETLERETVLDIINCTAFIKFNKKDLDKNQYQLFQELVDHLNPDRLVFIGKHDRMVEMFKLNEPTIFGNCKATAKGQRIFLFLEAFSPHLRSNAILDINIAVKTYQRQIEVLASKAPIPLKDYLSELKSGVHQLVEVVNQLKKNGIKQQAYEKLVVFERINKKLIEIDKELVNIGVK